MSIDEAASAAAFSDRHPHYTPRWLSEKLVACLPKDFTGTIVDPACGAGNLLAAAAMHVDGRVRQGRGLGLVGIDVSKRAVRACTASLASLGLDGQAHAVQADFLRWSADGFSRPIAVVMNPPFRGYGRINERTRKRLANKLRLRGRFNLAYAFVRHAIAVFGPTHLAAILPSNWVYSKGSCFRSELNAMGGTWTWEDIGSRAFSGLSVDVGIMVWRSGRKTTPPLNNQKRLSPSRSRLVEVRQGVATGRDALFMKIAKNPPPFGTLMDAVRGKDVARNSSVPIWVPPEESPSCTTTFTEHVSNDVVKGLLERSCVSIRGRLVYEYHESLPDWFIKGPKLLIPEIIVGPIRIELDTRGTKLPLHSVIAVRAPSIAAARRIRRFLLGLATAGSLLKDAPRLSGGALRLQVGTVRNALAGWSRSSAVKA
jgi:predicted RNA methylase